MTQAEAQERLGRLLGYLEQDPRNAALLRDAAAAALDANDPQKAKELFVLLRNAGELTEADSNLWAIAAMRSGEPELAAETFAGLLQQNPADPAVRFNLAWARALAKDAIGAREVLDEVTVAALPQAAALEIRLMHAAGEFEAAAERGREHMRRHGDYAPLCAMLSVLALDLEDADLARECAGRAEGHPDGLTTLGMLALDERELASDLFQRALALDPQSPRAWIGLGLAELARGQCEAAAENLDRGAGIFGDHLGSWIAAGWAWLLAGDRGKARERFTHAVNLDGNFAEAQGSLAVTDFLEGKRDAAERRMEIAARLDRQSFAAAFARLLLNPASGDGETAQRIADMALNRPLGPDGRTLADAIARLAR